MTRQRSTLSKTDYDLAAAFLKKMKLTVVAMDILPGKASLFLSDGTSMGLPLAEALSARQSEIERAKENWGA